MANRINPVRQQYGDIGTTINLLAHVRSPEGETLPFGTAVDRIEVTEEFGQYRTRYIDPSNATFASLQGSENDMVEGWSPGRDGSEGFNLTVTFSGEMLEFVQDPTLPLDVPAPEPSKQGLYRIKVSMGGTTQEFSLSVRA